MLLIVHAPAYRPPLTARACAVFLPTLVPPHLFSTSALVYFPYVIGIISTLLLLCGLLGGTLVYIDHHLRATTLLTCWVVADVLSLASIDLGKFYGVVPRHIPLHHVNVRSTVARRTCLRALTPSYLTISPTLPLTTLTTTSLAKFATPDTANEEKHGLLERALLNLAGGLLLGW